MTESQLAYREYLKSDHWRQLRFQAFKRWGRKCFKCPKTFGLDVHHLQYRHPWTLCTVEDVRPCCRECHEKEHGLVVIVPRDEKVLAQKLHSGFEHIKWLLANKYRLMDKDRAFLNSMLCKGTPEEKKLAHQCFQLNASIPNKKRERKFKQKFLRKQAAGRRRSKKMREYARSLRQSRRSRYDWSF